MNRTMWISMLACTCMLYPSQANADVFVVNNEWDIADASPGDGYCLAAKFACTLRAAVMEANANPGHDTIMLPPGTFTLRIAGSGDADGSRGDLDIDDDLTILA